MKNRKNRNKTIKRIAAAVFVVLLLSLTLFSLAACKAMLEKEKWEDNGKLNIITTVFPQYDFVKQIAGDKVNLKVLTPPGGDTHAVEVTSNMQKLISECDLFIMIGGEAEAWANSVLSSAGVDTSRRIALIDGISLIEVGGDHDHDHSHDHDHNYDEHIWTSPKNAIIMSEAISKALCELDAENSDFYTDNTEKYVAKLNKLDADFREMISDAARDTIIVADRFPFVYFTTEYNLNYYSAFDGCTANADPSAVTIKKLIDKVKENNINHIFYVEFSSKAIANTVAEETGAKLKLLHSCHNISKDDYDAGISYIDLMEQNLNTLREVLNNATD